MKSRLKPGGRIVIISTRWHEDDLCGRLLAELDRGGGDIWDTLILPAIAEENDPLDRRAGEFLWDDDPDYDYSDFLRQQLATQPPMNWAAMFMQRPAPASGDFFKIEWLKPYDRAPDTKSLRTYAATDYAVTSKGGDYTVHIVVGIDPENNLYVLDLWRAQASPDVWVEKMLDLAKKWKPISWAEEVGQIRASVGPFIERRMTERKIPLYRQQFPTRHDKAVRAQAIRGRMSLAGLHVPVRAPWYAAFQQELLTFPAGKHDDKSTRWASSARCWRSSCRISDRRSGRPASIRTRTPIGNSRRHAIDHVRARRDRSGLWRRRVHQREDVVGQSRCWREVYPRPRKELIRAKSPCFGSDVT